MRSIILVEDDAAIRAQIAHAINESSEYELLNESETMAGGLSAINRYSADILVTDLGLPDGSGVDIIQLFHHKYPQNDVLVISGFQDEHQVFSALEAGAKGYVLKHTQNIEVIPALDMMCEGGAPISPIIAKLMLNRFNDTTQAVLQNETLTERQIKILKFVSQGFSSKEISEKLSISYYTVTTHIKHIYEKLQVNSRIEAIQEARKMGIVHD